MLVATDRHGPMVAQWFNDPICAPPHAKNWGPAGIHIEPYGVWYCATVASWPWSCSWMRWSKPAMRAERPLDAVMVD